MTIGEKIKQVRKSKNLTQGEVSKKIGWPAVSRLSNYENNIRMPGADDLIAIAAALETSPGIFLEEANGAAANGSNISPSEFNRLQQQVAQIQATLTFILTTLSKP